MIKRLFNIQFVKFLLTGALNTAFGFCMYVLFTYLTNHEYLSIILANITGIIFNFKTYAAFVFHSTVHPRIFRFLGSYVIVIALQMAGLKFLYSLGVKDPYLAGAINTFPMAVISFLILKKIVFNLSTLPLRNDHGTKDA